MLCIVYLNFEVFEECFSMFFCSMPFNPFCEDTTNFPNVHVHLPEIRRKAGLVGHTGHHFDTSTPHLAGQLRVGEAAQDRGPRRCLSHPWSLSITFYHRTYHRTYHFNGSSMFKLSDDKSWCQHANVLLFHLNKVVWSVWHKLINGTARYRICPVNVSCVLVWRRMKCQSSATTSAR